MARTAHFCQAPGVIFLSGDVHFCEITRYDCGPMGYPLFDITSSGLTQAVEEVGNSVLAFILRFAAWLMPNSMRVYNKQCRHKSCVYGKYFLGLHLLAPSIL
jgi:alkaline phosphatase D